MKNIFTPISRGSLKVLLKSTDAAVPLVILLLLIGGKLAEADSATWLLNPSSSDWNTASNWMPNTVPNGAADTATFAVSNMTELSLSEQTTLDGIIYQAGASAFTINLSSPATLTFTGVGIANHSGLEQNFATNVENQAASALILFTGDSNAGENVVFTNNGGCNTCGGAVEFFGNSSASGATFINNGMPPDVSGQGGHTDFHDDSSAAGGTFVNNPNAFAGGVTNFFDNSNAGAGTFSCYGGDEVAGGGGHIFFYGTSSAASGTFALYGPTAPGGVISSAVFNDSATADHGTFIAHGGTVDGLGGGEVFFFGGSSAGDGTFMVNGATVEGAAGGALSFVSRASAAHATIILNGGANGGGGGECSFGDNASGGTPRMMLYGNSTLTLVTDASHPVALGSLEGEGTIILSSPLQVGSNDLSTTFSGVITGFGPFTKLGAGTLTLTGASGYRAKTTISQGGLVANNSTGSATGMSPVTIEGGTLAGKGIISGTVTVGTGSGTGAFLAPGKGAREATTLTIQSALTFKADGTFLCRLNTRRGQTDQVAANGVTIESGAQFDFRPLGNERLGPGQSFLLMSNTSTSPINGEFANLPDGSTFRAGRNNFRVSYSGGDGNDLTLTVLP